MDHRSITAARNLAASVVVGATLAISVAILPGVRAQEKGTATVTTVPRLHFEVASIRPSARQSGGGGGFKSKEKGPAGSCGGIGQAKGLEAFLAAQRAATRRLCLENRTLLRLIYDAYGIQSCPRADCELVTGGPAWIRSDEFDVVATAPESSPTFTMGGYAQTPHVQEMLRTLLAERFTLRMRHETRDFPVYALTVARGGHKLTPNTDPADAPRGMGLAGTPGADTARLGITNQTITTLAAFLSSTRIVGRPVVDRTGLEGRFDFNVLIARDNSPDSSAPSIFTAFEQELGLRLEPTRAPLEVLVIDQVERPSEN